MNTHYSEFRKVKSAIYYYEKGAGRPSVQADKKLIENKCKLQQLLMARPEKQNKHILYPVKGRYPYGSRTKLVGGISRALRKDGLGRSSVFWQVSFTVNGVQHLKKFSEDKYGMDGAKMLCSLYRMAWMIETGIWNPKDGDPFSILGKGDFFAGRADMENTGCDYETARQMRSGLES